MNLATATRMCLEGLGLVPSLEERTKPLPFRPSLGLNRKEENVRPIFWKNRHISYVQRTQDWDEFPNGRWGDSRSPAFGELDTYGIGLRGSNEANIKIYGYPKTIRDLGELIKQYLTGNLPSLPWSEGYINSEADAIRGELLNLNERGFLTINSQPAVNGVKSTHPVHGWGPKNGYVYQKSYLELLVSPEQLTELVTRIERDPDLSYHAVDKHGTLKTNSHEGPNAVTWGVYPGKEIIQPTIVETISFLAWKDEAFRLGDDWAKCYEAGSVSRHLIQEVMDTWFLVNIGRFLIQFFRSSRLTCVQVDNDFHQSEKIYRLFDGMEVPNMDENLVDGLPSA